MRKTLSDILHWRYHRLYAPRCDAQPRSFRLFGFQSCDGWFGLIEALSFVLAARVAGHDLSFSIIQVKEKFGTLRYYADGMDDFCRGAKWFAETMSGRLSERSGRAGLPSQIDRYVCTLAPGEDPAAVIRTEYEPTERFLANCGPANALAMVRAAWPTTRIEVSPGHADLVDVLIGFLTAGKVTVPPSAIIVVLGTDAKNRLIVDMTDLDESQLGGIAVASRLAAMWIDPLSGDTGPVDDHGRPTWAAGQQRA